MIISTEFGDSMPWAAAEKSALNTGLRSIRSAKRSNTKSRLLLDFRRGAQRVSPVCCGLLLWFRWAGCEKVDQSPHGRDGHAPFFCAAKSNFKEAMV